MKKYSLCYFVLFISLVFYGCSRPAAEVNGEKISMKTYKKAMELRLGQHSLQGTKIKESQMKDAVIQQLIGERLLLQVAREKNISVSEDKISDQLDKMKKFIGEKSFNSLLKKEGITVDEYKTRLKTSLTIQRLIRSLVPEDSISEKEMRKFYKNSPRPFIKPRKVMVRMIQTKTEEQAKAIIKDLKSEKGAFDRIAEKLKKDGTAVVSAYGWVNPSFFPKEISAALKNMKKGTYGGPYRGKDSFYIFRVKDRHKERPEKYEEAKNEIKTILLNQRRQAMIAHLVNEKKKKATIKINID
ncbi:peptidyl-prolyl cis-trans isomerase D [bacterium BMS3Abin07]|nr:peptidyl-prolyl cis-trans isomerase D [bacterium BMS3Abin07]GBE32307.1 peptidyl-prolyl cis-trans isomerase D [bacterium BMS3Bbin05]HDO23083.1 hypothetical protein [Nitrospirota bacterium]HDZ87875.1 hypothetical protein [Nitrospirota bacterium]